MGLADKLLCEVIQFNLRAATIIIAAMNMVASIVALIVCSLLLFWHAGASGTFGQSIQDTVVQGANEIVEVQGNNTDLVQTNGKTNARLEPATLYTTYTLLVVCIVYIFASTLLIIATKKEKPGFLFLWIILTVIAIIFFAAFGVVELALDVDNYLVGGCSFACVPIALFQLLVVHELRKELSK